jgi:hypothetical protein
LVARDIEVEFVNFGRSLPQMLDATSTSKSTKAHKGCSGKSTLRGWKADKMTFWKITTPL